jgi:hypothetical protein
MPVSVPSRRPFPHVPATPESVPASGKMLLSGVVRRSLEQADSDAKIARER